MLVIDVVVMVGAVVVSGVSGVAGACGGASGCSSAAPAAGGVLVRQFSGATAAKLCCRCCCHYTLLLHVPELTSGGVV